MRSVKAVLAAVVLVAASVLPSWQPGFAQSSDELNALRKELEAIKDGQNKLQKDVQEIKTLLQQGPRAGAAPMPPPAVQPVNMVITLDGDPVKGDRNARVVVVEYTDYQCPFCARHVRDTMPQLEAEYIKTGKIRYVTREFPLESIHPQAFKASEAALCAADQGKYWEMHARLFSNQRALAPDQLGGHAQAVGLDEAAFKKCLDGGTKAAKVRKDLAEGAKTGVTGTPAFFIGTGTGATVTVTRSIRGAHPIGSFRTAIDAVSAAAK